jgi:ribonuclease VapC
LSAVITRRRLAGAAALLAQLAAETAIEIVAVTPAQAAIGHRAYCEYGIGSGHRARLNFGDCFAYALAKERGEPLLYKGDDFVHTDVVAAL